MKHYLEYKDNKSQKFWQIEQEENSIITTFGKIGAEGKTQTKNFEAPEKASAYYQKQVFKKVDGGYLSKDLPFEIKTCGELGILDSIQNSLSPDEQCIVFKDNVVIPHSILLDYHEKLLYAEERSIAGIYAEGDLTVEGAIYNGEMDFGPFLLVEGNLKVKSLLGSGSEIIIKGDLQADYIGHKYNHGYIKVQGKTKAKLAVYEFWQAVQLANYSGLTYTIRNDEVYFYINDQRAEDKTYNANDLLKVGGSINNFLKAMYEDKPLIKDNALTIKEKITKLLQKKLESPERVKTLSLENKGLKQLPNEIFQFENLIELNIKGNNISEFPVELKSFSKLERLFFSNNRFKEFPEIVTEVHSLRNIHAAGNNFKTLPKTIGKLTNLVAIDLERNNLINLPEDLSNCTLLSRVNLRQQETGMWDVPDYESLIPSNFLEILAKLSNLKSFNVDWNLITALPKNRFTSEHLQEITIKGTLIKQESDIHPIFRIDNESSKNRIINKISELSKFSEAKDRELSAKSYAKKFAFTIELAIHFFDHYDEVQLSFEKELTTYFENRAKRLSDSYEHLESSLEEIQNLIKKYPKNELVQSIYGCIKDLYEQESIFHKGYENIPLPKLDTSKNYLYDIAQRYFKIRSRHSEKFEKIEIRFFTLNSEIPSEIFSLTNLKHLSLKNCKIKRIPEEISRLKKLEILDLEYNDISEIPRSILELKHLKMVKLNYNPIYETPEELSSIKSKIKWTE
ncbi:leucine-rich repeat domain-containing protein [Aquimarina litoralis]|uniref:leucine-rich repeat domain-containing protein n=1 Tax=Aquimarina litoralis TaxID=584605 RepID=UPI001C56AF6F|nr:leucine-rich repeat domain-containing protein [Aquimarina litoralis]MBW1298472.1 WGR domain-containing protein [Aquimarina litoralis]